MEDFEKRQIEIARSIGDSETDRQFCSNELIETKTVNEDDTATFIISTISLDAHRSIVNTRGLDYKTRFYDPEKKKNPINLFNHDYDKIVGNAMWVKHGDAKQTEMIMASRFTNATQISRDVKALIKDDVLRATSIGFIPKKNFFDDEAKKRFESDFSDLGLKAPDGLEWYIPESMLCEVSHVSVGSNMDALKRGLSEFDPYIRMILASEMLNEKVSTLEKNYTEMQNLCITTRERLLDEQKDRINERIQLIEIFKDALRQFKAGDVKRKPETLGEVNIERAIQNYINKKKGIF